MRKPTIHLNGTARAELLACYQEAASAVLAAAKAVSEAAPNGRDYYPQGPEAIREALLEHEARIAVLRSVHSDLLLLALHVADS